jgi:two-component system, OmpR family, phosphate regulon sensor histidine kinase PhoR
VSRRYRFLIAASAAIIAAILLIPSATLRGLSALVVGLLAAVLLVRAFTEKSSNIFASEADEGPDKTSDEIFALGKLFEATTGGMREGLLVVDRDLRVVASNPASHRLFNLSEGELTSQRLTELTRNRAIYSAFLDALKGKERSGVKVETHSPERRIFDLRVVPLGSADGQVTEGAIGIFFDVTRLEQLERVRQEFLSNVSHELRTPLTAILAFVETLEGGAINDSENSQRFLSIIRKNASRMHHLIDDILELTAIEAGNVQVEPKQVDLYPVVNDVVTSLATKASARGVALTNAVAPETTVYADARRLEQMMTNLVDNGIKFNREGGSVTIRYENGVRDGIFVEDTGEGIPAQHHERLFERFYRVDRARSREMGGTGLGLAIVKHLARAHGGEVTVTSTLGQGTRFTIELPKARPEKDEGGKSSSEFNL